MRAFLLLTILLPSRSTAGEASRPPPLASISELRELEGRVMAAAEKAIRAVVFIDGGSGFLISPDGYIITNNHVIQEEVRARRRRDREKRGALEIRVLLGRGRSLRAEIVGRDPGGDLALLKILEPGEYPFLELGDSDDLRPGQWVLALGNPFLLGGSTFDFSAGPVDFSPSVSLGIVSALHRSTSMEREDLMYTDAIQVDAAVNPGSSGGPLITMDGKVVGVTGKIQTRQNRMFIHMNSGVGYAVPSNHIRRFLDPLKRAKGGTVSHGTIRGLLVAERGDSEKGLEVLRIETGSPGGKAGFRPGDRILSIDGKPVHSRRRFDGLLASFPEGSVVPVTIEREGKRSVIRAFLDRNAPARLGVTGDVEPDSSGGVRISEVAKDGPADRAGLQAGDVILRIGDRKIEHVTDLIETIGEYRSGDTIEVTFLRASKEEKREVRLDAKADDER